MRIDKHDTIENMWPLTCVYCGSDSVVLLQVLGDAICLECKQWQLYKEEA